MSGAFHVVVPARYGSTRLPGKPLADIGGRPMIVRVAERAAAAGAQEVVVATDDQRIVDAVRGAGHQALLTRADHPTGSDRVMEVADARNWTDDALVINVQGDEPLIPPAVIRQLATALDGNATPVGTLCERLHDLEQLFDPNVVKVVRARDGRARYFSRAPIPYARDAFMQLTGPARGALPADGAWYRHIGIYGFRVHALRRFVSLPVSAMERLESLEQLRMLDHGIDILVAEAAAAVPGGVDTPEDLARVRALVADDVAIP